MEEGIFVHGDDVGGDEDVDVELDENSGAIRRTTLLPEVYCIVGSLPNGKQFPKAAEVSGRSFSSASGLGLLIDLHRSEHGGRQDFWRAQFIGTHGSHVRQSSLWTRSR